MLYKKNPMDTGNGNDLGNEEELSVRGNGEMFSAKEKKNNSLHIYAHLAVGRQSQLIFAAVLMKTKILSKDLQFGNPETCPWG